MQRDRMQMRQNTKRQFTNMTKLKKTKHKSNNIQYDKIQMQQNSKRHNTNEIPSILLSAQSAEAGT